MSTSSETVGSLVAGNPEKPMLNALLFGNFVVGSGVMVLPGMLTELAQGLNISITIAGHLIGIAGLAMAIGAPLFASITSHVDRRHLLVAALIVFCIGHIACALAPTYETLLPIRIVSVIGAVVFTPQAVATVGLIVPSERRASAVTTIFMGWSLASIFGMPLGALLADLVSWRAGFALVGVLSLLAAIWVARVTPSGLRVQPVSWSAWKSVLQNQRLLWVLSVTLLSAAAQFVVLSYISPSLRLVTQSGAGSVSLILVLFGITGFVGNVIANRSIDRIGVDRTVSISVSLMALGMFSWALIPISPAPFALPLLAAALMFWGLGCFSCNSAQQARLVAIAPALATVSIAMNTSSMYAAQAIGAGLGGLVIEWRGLGLLALVAGVIMLAALMASRVAASKERT